MRRDVQVLVPPKPAGAWRTVPYPEYLRQLRAHWLYCARQTRAEAQRRASIDVLAARRIHRAMLQAVLFARRINHELVQVTRTRV